LIPNPNLRYVFITPHLWNYVQGLGVKTLQWKEMFFPEFMNWTTDSELEVAWWGHRLVGITEEQQHQIERYVRNPLG
jgi:hypothetical protein